MDLLLLLVLFAPFSVQAMAFKEFNRSFMKNLRSYFVFNTLYTGIVALFFFIVNGGRLAAHASTIVTGVSFGICTVITVLFYMKAMENGPLAYTSLLYAFAIIVPVILDVIVWKISISLLQVGGLLLLLASFYIGSGTSGGEQAKLKLKWLLLCITALATNGLNMFCNRTQQIMTPGREINEFLIYGFGTAALISSGLFIFDSLKTKADVSMLKSRRFAAIVAAVVFVTATGNILTCYLAGKFTAVVLFPTTSAGLIASNAVLSVLIFKEKLSRGAMLGLCIGICSIVLLGMK